MKAAKGEWKAGYNPSVTGPTTPTVTPFCGGRDWPYRTINVGRETIAIVPAQADSFVIGQSNPILGSAEANACLIAAALNMYEWLKELRIAIGFGQERIGAGRVENLDSVLAKAEGQGGK